MTTIFQYLTNHLLSEIKWHTGLTGYPESNDFYVKEHGKLYFHDDNKPGYVFALGFSVTQTGIDVTLKGAPETMFKLNYLDSHLDAQLNDIAKGLAEKFTENYVTGR